jgi:hypothetical protein
MAGILSEDQSCGVHTFLGQEWRRYFLRPELHRYFLMARGAPTLSENQSDADTF